MNIICAPSVGKEQVARFEMVFYAVIYICLIHMNTWKEKIDTETKKQKKWIAKTCICDLSSDVNITPTINAQSVTDPIRGWHGKYYIVRC